MIDYNRKMFDLLMSFPSLANKVHKWGPIWDPGIYKRTILGDETLGSGATLAAEFVWAVWTGGFGTFNMFRALSVWDDEHKTAFRAWVNDPFFP